MPNVASPRLFMRSHVFQDRPFDDRASHVGARELLLAAIAACTQAALLRHAHARGWDVGDVNIDMAHVDDGGVGRIGRRIELEIPLDDHQRAELERVIDETPVTRVVAQRAPISTEMITPSREELDRRESAIDCALEDSFPASDPPSWTCG